MDNTKLLLIVIFLCISIAQMQAVPKALGIGMSALLPGSGEIALGKPTRGAILLTADLINWSLMLQSIGEVKSLETSYQKLAQTYAGAQPLDDSRYYQDIQNYRSSMEFNQRQEMLARNYYLLYLYDPQSFEDYLAANTYSDDESWNWTNDEQWSQYRKTRSRFQETKLLNNLHLGFILLNRVISMLDVAFINPSGGTQALYFSPSGDSGLMLNYQLGF